MIKCSCCEESCCRRGVSELGVLLPSYNPIGRWMSLQHNRSGDEDKEGIATPLDGVLWRSVRSTETIWSSLA